MPNSKDFNHFEYTQPDVELSRSQFPLDHSVKFSCNVGEVIPFDIFELVPGDTVSVDTTKVIRTQPLVAPIFDELILDTYYFFVPHRLVWNHFKNMMGENTSTAWTPTVEYICPRILPPSGGWKPGTIADYMGVPTNCEDGIDYINALPFRSYALICDQWFRSEALMDPVHVYVDDSDRTGVNTGNQITDIEKGGKPFIACKYFDYFTSALPSSQRGEPAELSVNKAWLPVVNKFSDDSFTHPYNVGESTTSTVYTKLTYKDTSDNTFKSMPNHTLAARAVNASSSSLGMLADTPTNVSGLNLYLSTLAVNTGQLAFSVNDLRTSFAVQRYLESQARYGGRYIEYIKGFFGVTSPDARLQRSEYIGGSRLSLNIAQVAQTAPTESDLTPMGSVAGNSVTADKSSDFTYSATEFGYIIGCAVVRYHHSYQNGLNKLWTRSDKFDFYNPVFAYLGEEAIELREIYAGGDESTAKPYDTFGFQERWSSYRYIPSRVAGDLRSDANAPLDMWHLGDYYTERPYLSADWIREDKSNLDRCLAVTSDVANQIICDYYIKVSASRPMPLYSIPSLRSYN